MRWQETGIQRVKKRAAQTPAAHSDSEQCWGLSHFLKASIQQEKASKGRNICNKAKFPFSSAPHRVRNGTTSNSCFIRLIENH